MRPTRCLNRLSSRFLSRHSARMLAGARRPVPPNYLAIACRAFGEMIKIDERLRPFMAEQRELVERWRWDQEVQAALNKIYGDSPVAPQPPQPADIVYSAKARAQLLRDEQALAKSRLFLESCRAKMQIR